jgi:predicted alpha-1,2-mannosidase
MLTAGRFGKGSEEYGQTLPAVLEPNGMNFWTAQTQHTELKCKAPYYYEDSLIQGFRNSHWIVGGCTQDYGSMTLFPATNITRCTPQGRAVSFSHSDEVARPDYYSVMMDGNGVFAEMTGKSRSAIFRFTYPADSCIYITVNPNSDEGEGYIELDTLQKEIRGYNPIHRIYQGKGLPTGHAGHFVVKFTDEIESFGTFHNDSITEGNISACNNKGIGIYVRLRNEGKPIIVRAASSFVSIEGARKNLEAEIPHTNFEQTRKELSDIWEKHLGCIHAETTDTTHIRKFYGSLYRTSFLPRTINDADGKYPAFANGTITHTNRTYYDDFSMWDTYRALHPLLVLLSPTKSGDMMQSLADKYRQGGWLPIFPCWNSYTAAMIGDHCTSAICDAYVKGVRNFDIQTAYEGMRKNAFEQPSTYEEYANGMGRRALDSYMKYGYIPLEDPVAEAYHQREQTSRTLEYAYDDFCLAQVAQLLGKTDDHKLLMKRSENFRNVMDPNTGYANGRHADGHFLKGTNPYTFAFYITEGAPCHYTWYVPHDIKGLMDEMGGRETFIAKLDTLFEQNLYWHGNEPCHQIVYLYNNAGEAWKTQKYVRHILDTEYGDSPGGLAGNDDAGQMSAWYVFSSLGFYPVCPGTPYYHIGTPTFKKAELHLENGNTFTIIAEGASKEFCYIESVVLNGKPIKEHMISHEDIIKGGTLEFKMANKPVREPL